MIPYIQDLNPTFQQLSQTFNIILNVFFSNDLKDYLLNYKFFHIYCTQIPYFHELCYYDMKGIIHLYISDCINNKNILSKMF